MVISNPAKIITRYWEIDHYEIWEVEYWDLASIALTVIFHMVNILRLIWEAGVWLCVMHAGLRH